MILGIDPGASGALAVLEGDSIDVYDTPHHSGIVSPTAIGAWLRYHPVLISDNTVCWIEDVHSMPRQGVASAFKFGRAFGTVIGVVGGAGIPINYVTPGKWKRALGLSSDKTACRRRAQELWPQQAHLFARVKDDGRAEAALIALYGSRQP